MCDTECVPKDDICVVNRSVLVGDPFWDTVGGFA
jgi:hypothetical protein